MTLGVAEVNGDGIAMGGRQHVADIGLGESALMQPFESLQIGHPKRQLIDDTVG